MFHSRHRQRGQSAWGSLFTIMMVLFLVITVMKLWGASYNDYSIGKVVTAMERCVSGGQVAQGDHRVAVAASRREYGDAGSQGDQGDQGQPRNARGGQLRTPGHTVWQP